jgi:hypothetical protein
MENYDTSIEVAYDTDDDYRRCLLAVFKLNEFGAELTNRVDALRKTVTNPELLETAVRLGCGFSDDLGFFMLFSYDEFKKTHSVLAGPVGPVFKC